MADAELRVSLNKKGSVTVLVTHNLIIVQLLKTLVKVAIYQQLKAK
jgi:hypothetical protein